LRIIEKPYFFNSKKINIAFPIIVKAYLSTDNLEKSIPIDVIEIKSKKDVSSTAIALFNKGNFTIQLVNKEQQTQIFNLKKRPVSTVIF
jgi:hypothetical protein